MKIKSGFILRKVAGEWVVIAIGPASTTFNKLVKLNDTGKFIWDLLAVDTDMNQLIRAITDEYDVEEEIATRDIENIIDQLTELGCIEE